MNRQRIRSRPTIADQAKAFGCVDAMLDKLSQGWIHEMQGQPVFRNPANETWYDIPAALAGWVGLWQRIIARHELSIDMKPLAKLGAKLNHGVPIQPAEVTACIEVVKQCKRQYRSMDVQEIGSLVRTQMIANFEDGAGLTGNEQGQRRP